MQRVRDTVDGEPTFTMKQKLSDRKRRKLPLSNSKEVIVFAGIVQAAATRASQPSAFSFPRYALILRSLLN